MIILDWLKFLVAVYFMFYVPGVWLTKTAINTLTGRVGLRLVVGMVSWAGISFFSGILGIRWLLNIYLGLALVAGGWYLIKILTIYRQTRLASRQIDWVFVGIAVIGIVVQLSTLWPFGTTDDTGMSFCCRGVPDMVYLTALTHELTERMPPQEPGAFGIPVMNYHYWSVLIAADMVRIFKLDLLATIGRYLPFLVSVLLAMATYTLAANLKLGKRFGRWLVFFVFFFGDLLFVLRRVMGQGWLFDIEILDDATKLVAGMPRAFSIVVFFWATIMLIKWIKKRSIYLDILLALLFASLVGFKVYTFVFVAMGLFMLGLYYLARREPRRLLLPVLTALMGLVIFWPVNGQSANYLWFHGPYTVHHFIERPELPLTFLELRRQVFLADEKMVKVGIYEFGFLLLYLITSMGTSLLAVTALFARKVRLPRELVLFLTAGIVGTFVLGIYSSQAQGSGLNTTQFVMALPYFLAIFSAAGLADWQQRWSKRWVAIITAVFVVGLTVPRAGHEFLQNTGFLRGRQEVYVPHQDLKVLTCLREYKNEGLLVMPSGEAIYQNALHVRFLGDKEMYFASLKGVLEDHQIDEGIARYEDNRWLFETKILPNLRKGFEDRGIRYIYGPKQDLRTFEQFEDAEVICENPEREVVFLK